MCGSVRTHNRFRGHDGAPDGEWERDNEARESWESAFGVGLLMVASEDHEMSCETQADVDVSLRRDRCDPRSGQSLAMRGLLPPMIQKPQAYRGSELSRRNLRAYQGSGLMRATGDATIPFIPILAQAAPS